MRIQIRWEIAPVPVNLNSVQVHGVSTYELSPAVSIDVPIDILPRPSRLLKCLNAAMMQLKVGLVGVMPKVLVPSKSRLESGITPIVKAARPTSALRYGVSALRGDLALRPRTRPFGPVD
jgi:hypothetical protein